MLYLPAMQARAVPGSVALAPDQARSCQPWGLRSMVRVAPGVAVGVGVPVAVAVGVPVTVVVGVGDGVHWGGTKGLSGARGGRRNTPTPAARAPVKLLVRWGEPPICTSVSAVPEETKTPKFV